MLKKIKSFLFENKTGRQTVAKNTAWLSISNYGGRIIKAAIVIYGARILDTAGYGVFSYAITLAGFMSLFLDPGINSILTRDVARAGEEEKMGIFATTFVIKVTLVIFGSLLIIFFAPHFSTLPGALALLPIVALIISFDTFRGFFSALMDAEERMEWDAIAFLVTNAAIVIFGFWFLATSKTAVAFTWAYALGTGVGALLSFILVFKYLKRSISHFAVRYIKPIMQAAWPFAIIGALGVLLTNTDILIISWMKSASDVGIYSGVIRIIQMLYVIPGIIQTATLPAFSRMAKNDPVRFRAAFERTLGFVFLASIPLALGGIILGTQVMSLVFGSAYQAGGASLRILMLSMVFDFPASVIAAAVFAHNHQKGLIVSSTIAGVANVALDLFLIPRFGITGSAVATLIAQVLSNWYLWRMMNKINAFTILPRITKIIAASAVMAALTIGMYLIGVEVIVNVVISSAAYIGCLWVFQEPLVGEMKLIARGNA
jgi:O-antigen/teichoic acid export membrane protein